MVVNVDTTNINKRPGTGGAGSLPPRPYNTPLQRALASGASIHDVARDFPQQQPTSDSDSGSGGGWVAQALTGTSLANGGSNASDKSGADAKNATGTVKELMDRFVAKAKQGVAFIGRGGQTLGTLNQNDAAIEKDIKRLTVDRDNAAGEVDSQGNPFDGTGAGTTSANNISGIGAHVKSTGRPGEDQDTTPTDKPSQGNSGAQARLDGLNSELNGKMTQREQIEQKREKTITGLKASYKSQIAPLKADGQRLAKQATDAEGKIKDAQDSQQKAGTVTTVGGATTAAGVALSTSSCGTASSLGGYMVKVGMGATLAGSAWSMKAKSAESSAQGEKTSVEKAEGNLVVQEKAVVTSYSKAINRARRAR